MAAFEIESTTSIYSDVLKLVPEGAPKSQAGDAARRAYRQVRGQDAPTGPSDY